jgi:predicted GNAT family acetyltransferase
MTGYTSLTPAPDGSLRITGTYTDPAARGAGLGQQRLAAAAQYAQDSGISLHSDTTVTAAQVKAYEAARNKGLIDFTPTDQGMYDAALRNKSETAVMRVGKEQPGIQNIVPGPNAPIAPKAAIPEPPTAAPASNVSEVASSPTAAPAPPAASMFRTPVEMGSGGAAGVGDVSTAEQAERAAAFTRVGVEEAHPGAISGDGQSAADAYTASKRNSEAGQRFKSVFQNERQSLREAAADAAGGTGGTPGIDPATLYGRGNDISAPLDDYRDYISLQTQKAYDEAKAKVGGVPVVPSNVHSYLTDNTSDFMATPEGKQLLTGVKMRLKDLGLQDKDAEIQAARAAAEQAATDRGATDEAVQTASDNAAQRVERKQQQDDIKSGGPGDISRAERFRQFLGDQWTPRTARLIGNLKDALDDDVSSTVGPQTFEAGRALRRLRETAIDGPEGVSSLLKSRDGIPGNRQTALENVPVQIEKMPQDQFSHLMDVLSDARKATPDLATKAERAVNAIRAQFASRVQSIGDSTQGMWNNKGVNTYLRTQEPKMAQVFSPAEMAHFKDINDVGNWVAPDRTYSGAAVQQANLMHRGLRFVEPTVEAVAAHAFGLPGYVAARAGTSLAKKLLPETEKLSDAEKVIERPKDYLK